MKFFGLYCFLFVEYYLCSADKPWQVTVPTGASKNVYHFLYINDEVEDGMKVERLQKIFLKFEHTLKKNIGKWRKKYGNDIPNLLKFITKDDKHLNKDIKHVLKKNVPALHHPNFLKKLNKFLGNLSKGKIESVHFFKNAVGFKLNKDVVNEHINYEDHSSLIIPSRNPNSEKNEKMKITLLRKKLEENVKKWTEPDFMHFDESKLIKKKTKEVPLMVFTSPGQIIQPSKSEVLINCIVTPKSNAKIRWEKDGKAVSTFKAAGKVNGHKYVFPNGSLYISALRKRDIGIYTCVASTKNSKKYATAAVAIAYLHHFDPIDPVKAFEGSTETMIKCIPPYGVPTPKVTWMKNGALIDNPRYSSDSWTLIIKDIKKSDAGNYTCCASNMARQRHTTTTLDVIGKPVKEVKPSLQSDKSIAESMMESWVGQHFIKPHHLSVDDNRGDGMLENTNSALDSSGNSKSLQREIEQEGIGKTVLKGLLEERNDLQWASNDVLSKLSAKQKKDYLDAERKWEMKLTQETQRLLDKLEPADAYIIPDVPIYDGKQTKKLEGLDAARVIKKELEDVARRKFNMDGNNWEGVRKSKKQLATGAISGVSKEVGKKPLDSKSFENKLAEEEEEWLGVEKKAWGTIRNLEKKLKKLKH